MTGVVSERTRCGVAFVVVVLVMSCAKRERIGADAARPASPSHASPTASVDPCPIGYVRRGAACVDLDECAAPSTPCGVPSATCRNLDGSYECTCPVGYLGGGPTGLACASRLAAGAMGMCGVPADGELRCVGAVLEPNGYDDTISAGRVPTAYGLTDVVAVSTSQPDHVCALYANGRVSCWGNNERGQLGTGAGTPAFRESPVVVPGLENVVAIDTSGRMSCALVRGGAVHCWGDVSTFITTPGADVSRPTRVPIDDVVQIALGGDFLCGLRREGTVMCGGGVFGGERGARFGEMRDVRDVVRIDASEGRALALRRDGTVIGWRPRAPFVGGPMDGPGAPPEEIAGLEGVVEISADGTQHCYVTRAGAVFCDGDAAAAERGWHEGQPPVRVPDDRQARMLTCGADHCCFTYASGNVACFGDGTYGQLERPRPEPLPRRAYVSVPAVDARWQLVAPSLRISR